MRSIQNDSDILFAKEPSILGRAAADQHIADWMQENDYEHFRDGEGAVWTLNVSYKAIPAHLNPKNLEHSLDLVLKAAFNAKDLIQQGVLDQGEDARLIALLEDRRIPMQIELTPRIVAGSLREIGLQLWQRLGPLRRHLEAKSLKGQKKAYAGQTVNGLGQFGLQSGSKENLTEPLIFDF